MTKEDDKVFGDIAKERIKRNPWRYYVSGKVYYMTQFLFNRKTAAYIHRNVTGFPPPLNFAIRSGFILAKWMSALLFFIGVARLISKKAQRF